ncbi:MAG TPA: shikimate dehydrogenase [Xanthobacteraceae bacterium]|nr:shikimate dehydrogenase [Xanthobacteraceae bacterium]
MSSEARAVCVIGWPVKHSRSPLIHNFWLKQHGIAGEYRREAVPPEDFPKFIANLAGRGYSGANITLPHKEAALQLSGGDARARAVGAANTLWFDRGRLQATNTDVEGFVNNLDAAAPGWDAGLDTAVVLGAGGGARAVLFGLLERGVQRILLVNRTRQKTETLAAAFGPKVQPVEFAAISEALRDCGLVVNTTSLGMLGQPALDIDLAPLRESAVVADLVYVPLRTGLLAQAQQRNLRTADGLGMLLHQAVRGFSLWFGVQPQVTPDLRALLEADLTR